MTVAAETIKLRAGDYRYPVQLIRDHGLLRFQFRYNKELIDEIKTLEGRRWDKEARTWTAPDSPRNRFTLAVLQGEPVLDAYDADLEARETTRDVFAHQALMVDHILRRRRCFIVGEMGVGKTLAAIEAMEQSGIETWWVVAPKSALRSWELEVEKWECRVPITFISYDMLWKVLEGWPEGNPPPRAVIFDESSRIKNPTAKRSKAARHLANAMEEEWRGEEYVILMTGTPAPQDPSDWWHQCEVVRPGFLREGTIHQFRERVGIVQKVDYGFGDVKKVVRWKAEEVELLGQRMKGLVETWLKKDCLDLPEKIYEVRTILPSDAMLRAARLIAADSESTIQTLIRIRELSDGFQYRENDEPIRVASPKLDELTLLLEDHEEIGRLVVYAGFRESVIRVIEHCRALGWETIQADGTRQPTKDELKWFQSGEGKVVFVGNPGAAGMGLTLTASPTIVYFSNDYNAESRMQSEDRIHRPGCRGARIVDLVHLPTDGLVIERLKSKRDLQSIPIEEIRKALQ